MADLLKKKLWGFNVVGAQGVNAKNDIEVGVTGNMGVYYDGLPAIRVGNRLFTPVGNVIEGEGEDEFIPEEQIPDIPEDAIEDGVNYILGLDENAEVAWIKFPNLPEDFDEKNYVLALDNEGEMIWKEEIAAPATVGVVFSGDIYDMSVTVNGTPISFLDKFSNNVTLWFKAGDELDVTGMDGTVVGTVNGTVGEGTIMTFPYTISGEEFYIEINDIK